MENVPLPTVVLRKLPGINQMHSANDLAATVKVVAKKTAENPSGYVVIDAGQFDAKTHTKYDGPDFDPVAFAAAEAAAAEAAAAEAAAAEAAAEAAAAEAGKKPA